MSHSSRPGFRPQSQLAPRQPQGRRSPAREATVPTPGSAVHGTERRQHVHLDCRVMHPSGVPGRVNVRQVSITEGAAATSWSFASTCRPLGCPAQGVCKAASRPPGRSMSSHSLVGRKAVLRSGGGDFSRRDGVADQAWCGESSTTAPPTPPAPPAPVRKAWMPHRRRVSDMAGTSTPYERRGSGRRDGSGATAAAAITPRGLGQTTRKLVTSGLEGRQSGYCADAFAFCICFSLSSRHR